MRRTLTACLLVASSLAQTKHFDDANYRNLFDGATLDGWVTAGGRYDGDAVWSVEDGAITGREGEDHAGGLIYTDRYYSSFVFTCDAFITYPFDSGVFVRMVPRGGGKGAQITFDYRPNGEVGAVYADGFLQHNQTGKSKFRRDQWNHIEVRCRGRDFRLECWLNGEKITDYKLPAGSEGYAPSGRIGLQVHGGRNDPEGSRAQFRNIKIRELPDSDPDLFDCDTRGQLELTDAGREAGWRKLFNGEDLTGWEPTGKPDGYIARDGVLSFPKAGGGGYLRTTEDFEDFEFRMDFKTSEMANSGLFLRGDRNGGDPAYSGCEIQILDDFNWESVTDSKLKPWQFTGSLYASVPAGDNGLRPIGTWNTLHVTYRGSRLRVELNGKTLYDVDTFEVPVAYADRKKFADRAPTGFIGLQRHAPREVKGEAWAWFKNIFVRPLR